MNPYPARIEELHNHLESRYGQRDRQATEILLCALLPTPITRAARPWFVIETDYPSRDTSDAWFSFGGIVPVMSLAAARVQRNDQREQMINVWLAARQIDETGLFVDAEWRRLTHLQAGRAHPSLFVSSYGLLMSRCLRLRVEYPKGGHAARLDKEADKTELARLTRRVLDNEHRSPATSAAPVPAGMYYWCELLQRLSTLQTDWDALIGSLAATARNVSILYNDPVARQPDWHTVERLIRDMVNYTTAYIVRQCGEKKKPRAWDTYNDGYKLNRDWNREIARLRREGVIDRYYRLYGPISEDWKTMTADGNGEPMFTQPVPPLVP